MSWYPIAKVAVGFAVGLVTVGLVVLADRVGIDLRAPAAVLLGVVITSATAYLTPDSRVDQRGREPNGTSLRERGAS